MAPSSVLSTITLEFKRSGDSFWTDITSSASIIRGDKIGSGTITHTITNNDDDVIQYKLTVEDTANEINIATFDVNFAPYVANSVVLSTTANTQQEIKTTANIPLTITFNNSNSAHPLVTFNILRSVNNGASFTSINSLIGISTGHVISDTSSAKEGKVIYKIIASNDLGDEVTSNLLTINYYSKSYLGYLEVPLTAELLPNLANGALAANGAHRTI